MKRSLVIALSSLAILAGIAWATIGPYPNVGLTWIENFDPTTGGGVSAPLNQFLIRTDVPSLYYKSGAANTAWTLLGVGGGGGSVTSITCGVGELCTATNPITTTGTITLDITPTTCSAGMATTAIASDGTASCSAFATGTLPVTNVWFGTGDDGSTAPCGTISVNTNLARDIHCQNLTINPGITLNTLQFKVYVAGTLTIGAGAVVGSNGNPGSGTSGGSAIQTAFYVAEAGGASGGGAGGASGSGGNGGGVAPCEWPNAGGAGHGAAGVSQGAGGGGGNGGGGTGGTGGSVAQCGGGSINLGGMTQSYLEYGFLKSSALPIQGPSSGGGGAAGGGGTTCTGGGSGGAGGFTYVTAKILAGSGVISSTGGNGANAGAGTGNCGGGGGGGGGLLAVIYGVNSGSVTTSVAGGSGGAPIGTGEAGGAGHAGQAWVWSVGSD